MPSEKVLFQCLDHNMFDVCLSRFNKHKVLSPGTRYLKVDVQHRAVLRHQELRDQRQLKRQAQDQQHNQETMRKSPPSRLYEQLQRSLKSLEPMDMLAATARKHSLLMLQFLSIH